MSERSEINARADKILRNDIKLASVIRDLNGIFATMDADDFGVSTHEVEQSILVVERMKKQTGRMLAEMFPPPTTNNLTAGE